MTMTDLLNDRQIVECNFIFCLYKEPENIPTYKNLKNGQDILTEDGKFYFGLANAMYEQGLRNFDNISVLSFINKNSKLKEQYEKKGGFTTIQEITSLISIDNLDGYYEELVKSNLLIALYKAGFPIESELEKFSKMSSSISLAPFAKDISVIHGACKSVAKPG